MHLPSAYRGAIPSTGNEPGKLYWRLLLTLVKHFS